MSKKDMKKSAKNQGNMQNSTQNTQNCKQKDTMSNQNETDCK